MFFKDIYMNMTRFVLKRLWQAVLVMLGVNLLTFILFFNLNTVDDMARLNLGGKRVTPQAIELWKTSKGYDLPLWWNETAGAAGQLTDYFTQTLWVQKSLSLFALDFGASDSGRDIAHDIATRALPSLALALPSFALSVVLALLVSLGLLLVRHTRLDVWGVLGLLLLMSISGMFYIIGGQWLLSKTLGLLPISGYADGVGAWRFLLLPLGVGVFSGLGGQARSYRAYFLEELNKDYVRTALAKGVSDWRVLRVHVLRNALIPILTGVVAVIPHLFTGSLVMESFFGIPGLGNYVMEAINAQDFAIVRVMVFIGAGLTALGYALTDIAYCIADPRVRLA
jgi:peptide/nickel transport system permease protein